MTQPPSLAPFKGRHFDQEIIVLCVRWYLSFKLSSRDLVRMMAERRVVLAHTTILRWVQRYVPEFEKCWSRYARDVDGSWRCDETYIKVRGNWTYLYRAVDKGGRTVDFLLSERREVAAAKCFFTNAIRHHGTPRVITRDAYAASHRAIRELKSEGSMSRRVRVRSSKYLNNIVEQDHRRIKTADSADAWIQAIRHGDSHDQRHRIGGKDQESSVQDWKANAPTGDSAGNLGSRSGLLNNSTVLILLYCFNSTIRICTRTLKVRGIVLRAGLG